MAPTLPPQQPPMAPSPPPPPMPTTASRCAVDSSRGAHVFEVADYSLHLGLGVGRFIRSATFDVGGYDWCIRFYPDGYSDEYKDYFAVAIELLTADAVVSGSYRFGLTNQITGERWLGSESRILLDSGTCWCRAKFMKRSQLEASQNLRDDRLAIRCVVTVVKETRVSEASMVPAEIDVPPSDLQNHLGRLLEEGDGADVTFEVQGESFRAHRMVLAMRSPVFKAELQGQMMEGSAEHIAISDMQPAVFKALLHFVYTDSLPAMDDLDKKDNLEMVRHLLVAADRYGMDRLKLICARFLSKSLEVDSVATTLVLGDRHNCSSLKDACIEFIMASNKMDDVVKTQGYAGLKRYCPSVLGEVLEKAAKWRKI
ncbi:hypothetical protein EJB05_09024, partial [Eragrostis curvula]